MIKEAHLESYGQPHKETITITWQQTSTPEGKLASKSGRQSLLPKKEDWPLGYKRSPWILIQGTLSFMLTLMLSSILSIAYTFWDSQEHTFSGTIECSQKPAFSATFVLPKNPKAISVPSWPFTAFPPSKFKKTLRLFYIWIKHSNSLSLYFQFLPFEDCFTDLSIGVFLVG